LLNIKGATKGETKGAEAPPPHPRNQVKVKKIKSSFFADFVHTTTSKYYSSTIIHSPSYLILTHFSYCILFRNRFCKNIE